MKLCPILLIAILFISCQKQKDEMVMPSEETMVDILLDLHMAEPYIQGLHSSTRDSVGFILKTEIAEIYGYSPRELELIIDHLQNNPGQHQVIYEQVIAKIDSLAEASRNSAIQGKELQEPKIDGQ